MNNLQNQNDATVEGVNCKQLLCVLREHLDWLDNELFAWKKNPEDYTVEDGPDLKSRRDELLQIFKECKIPRNA